MAESALVAKLLALARSYGAEVEKNHGSSYQRRGRPDIEGCHQGLFIAFEAKQLGKKATDLQARKLLMLRRAGAYASVVDTYELAVEFFENFPYCCRVCLKPTKGHRHGHEFEEDALGKGDSAPGPVGSEDR